MITIHNRNSEIPWTDPDTFHSEKQRIETCYKLNWSGGITRIPQLRRPFTAGKQNMDRVGTTKGRVYPAPKDKGRSDVKALNSCHLPYNNPYRSNLSGLLNRVVFKRGL